MSASFEFAQASNGVQLDLTGAMTFNYNVDDTVNYAEVVSNGVTYRQTCTYDVNGNLTAVSAWTAQ